MQFHKKSNINYNFIFDRNIINSIIYTLKIKIIKRSEKWITVPQ